MSTFLISYITSGNGVGRSFKMLDQYVELGLCHCRNWQPSRPEGDGWFVLSIHDTEDGPVCVWGRRIEQEQPHE